MARFKVNDMIDDIVNDYRKQVAQALKRAEQEIRVKMQEIIQEYMLDDYYQGYTPKLYVRIYQLEKSVGPYTELKEAGNTFGLAFGIDTDDPYGPGAMDHSELTVRYSRKKRDDPWKKTYDKTGKVDEEEIFENFLAGIHPNVGQAKSHHIRERVGQRLDYFLEWDAPHIISQELDKIK